MHTELIQREGSNSRRELRDNRDKGHKQEFHQREDSNTVEVQEGARKRQSRQLLERGELAAWRS